MCPSSGSEITASNRSYCSIGFLQEITIQFIIAFLNIFVITWPLLILVFKDAFLRQQTFHSLPLSEAKQT